MECEPTSLTGATLVYCLTQTREIMQGKSSVVTLKKQMHIV